MNILLSFFWLLLTLTQALPGVSSGGSALEPFTKRDDSVPYVCSGDTCPQCLISSTSKISSPANYVEPRSDLTKRAFVPSSSPNPQTLLPRTLVPPIPGQMSPFMIEEVNNAVLQGHDTVHGAQNGVEWSTAYIWPLRNSQSTISVQGLWGCTSIIVLTETAIYTSHFWEGAFRDTNRFQNEVMNMLGPGNPAQNMAGLQGVFDFTNPADDWMEIWIITPTLFLSPDPTILQYPDEIDQIEAQIRNILPNAQTPQRFPYERLPLPIFQQSTFAGKTIVRYDPKQAEAQPANMLDCPTPIARLELWNQDSPLVTSHQWNASPNQLKKRDSTCSGPSPDPEGDPPCVNVEDPDSGKAGYCSCSGGITVSNAASTGTNTGANYKPCPFTAIPTLTSVTPPMTTS
jgi:hypothetical protein